MNLFDLMAKISLDTSEYEDGLENAENKGNSFAKSLGSGIKKAAKVGTVAVGAFTAATTLLGKTIVGQTGQLASYGDHIDKTSQKMGISAQAYQEWDAILQHSGTSIDGMQRGMMTLTNKVVAGSEAFDKLGISQEYVSSMSKEDLFSAVITGLQGMEDGSERAALAQELLGTAAKELGPLLNTSAEETEAMRQRVHELGGVMSDEAVKAAAAYQDSLQDMKTAFAGLKRGLLYDFMPGITQVMDGLTKIFSGDNSGIGMVSAGINSVITTIREKLPTFAELGNSIIGALKDAFANSIPAIHDIWTNILGGTEESWSKISESTSEWWGSIAHNLSNIWGGIKDTASFVWNGLKDFFSENGSAIGDRIASVWTAISRMLSAFWGALSNLATSIFNGLKNFWSTWGGTITTIFSTVWDTITTAFSGALDVLTALFGAFSSLFQGDWEGFWNGILATGESLWNTISNTLSALWSGIQATGAAIWAAIGADITAAWESIKATTSSMWEAIKTAVADVWDGIKSSVSAAVESVESTVSGVWESMKSTASEVWDGIKSTISDTLNSISETVSSSFNAVLSAATGVWNSIKNAISDAINGAKDIVSEAIEGIKGLFDFSWSLPHISLPHFSLGTGISVLGITLPSINVDWYKKAYETPYLFDKPTVVGNRGFGDGNGAEIVYGHTQLMSDIRNAVGQMMPQQIKLYLDGDKLVGGTSDRMDSSLGEMQQYQLRWEGA